MLRTSWSISVAVVSQLKARADLGALYEAERLARLHDEAVAAGDQLLALQLESDITGTLGTVYVDGTADAFAEWRGAGFPDGPAVDAQKQVMSFFERHRTA